jgi:hypothetical protein
MTSFLQICFNIIVRYEYTCNCRNWSVVFRFHLLSLMRVACTACGIVLGLFALIVLCEDTNNDVPHYVIRFASCWNRTVLSLNVIPITGVVRKYINVQIVAFLRSVSLWHEVD